MKKQEEKKTMTLEERSDIALRIAKILEKEAGQEGVLILDQALLLHAHGYYRIIQGRS
jgi:hypothetical protein